MPWPSVENSEKYARWCEAVGSRTFSATLLSELIELRNKMGNKLAFMGDEKVEQAIEIATVRPGAFLRAKGNAKQEEVRLKNLKAYPTKTSDFNVPAWQLLGPKGGLPKGKPELTQLARALGIEPGNKTSDQLKIEIRPLVACGALSGPPPESPEEKSGAEPSKGSAASVDKGWEWLDPKKEKAVQQAVANALSKLHVNPPTSWIEGLTREALSQASDERGVKQKRTEEYFVKDDRMVGARAK